MRPKQPHRASSSQIIADILAWAVALTLASLLRVDFETEQLLLWGQIAIVPVAGVLQFAAGWWTGLYTGRWRTGSFDEAPALGRTVAAVTAGVFLVDLLASHPRMIPLSACIGAGVISFVAMGAQRYLVRHRREARLRPSAERAVRTLVVGAGHAGDDIVRQLLRDPEGRLLPVALLDDDPAKQRLRLHGVPVVGTVANLAEAAQVYETPTVLLAIPSAGRDLVAAVTQMANEAGLDVKVLPAVRELIEGEVSVSDIRSVEPADLLGRREVTAVTDEARDYLRGRRVLVTGAGGSIGSELCRQIHAFEPECLVMLDRDESALHALQLSIEGRALLDKPNLVLGDIRDARRMAEIFDEWRPDVVFHTAALKHLPMLERAPVEAWKTNVQGTSVLLEQAVRSGVDRFVNISTDKAADPTSVLGFTKRIAERLTAEAAARADGTFVSVRFGNVLGSRGSMLDTFRAQILAGGPITVTDPEVTRFFMTAAEACELVIQAGAIGRPGEVMVLDMGEPVRIADVAAMLARQAPEPVDIVYTGLRHGEKMDEVLFSAIEHDERPFHPLVSHVDVPPIGPRVLTELADDLPTAAVVEQLRAFSLRAEHEPAH